MIDQRRVTLWIFLFFQALYGLTSSGNAFRVPDEFEVYYQVEHLVDDGDLSVPQALASGRFFGRVGLDGKPYAPYGPFAAFLSVPHHLLARGITWLAAIPRENVTWTFVVSGLTMLSTATAAALAVAGFYRAAMLIGGSQPVALLLSLMLGGASVLWTYGASFYSEAWQAAAFIWAAVFLLERRVPLSALLLAVAGLTKATSLVFAPGFLVAVFVARSEPLQARLRAGVMLSAGVAAAAAIHLAWNDFRFGNMFDFGYDWAETIPVLPARAFLLSELPRGLVVLLLSPGKSILLWAPVIVLSVTRVRTCPRPLLAGVATSAITGLIFYGAYLFPEGGYAHGPRHLVPIVPLLLLPAATPGPSWRREIITACAAVGIAMALLSVSVSFLQDQALGSDFQRLGYYERINPPPGRAWNRYRLEYIPFIRTTTSPDWPASRRVGAGLDFFPLHLVRARAAIPAAKAIPIWLPWALLLGWGALLIAAARTLWPTGHLVSATESPSVWRTEGKSLVISQRLIGAALVALSLVYLWMFVPRGWIPHDEGMTGQSAERVLAGDLPHVDYEEPYTGGLAWLHAAVFKVAGIDLVYLRWLLFAGAALAQLLTYLILRRYLGPIGAALGAWVALGWSFPNYFAALPSWWVLVCALGCVWAFIRYVETGMLRYVAVAGLVAGVSILIKQTGLYLVVALVLTLLYDGGSIAHRRSSIVDRRSSIVDRSWWPGSVLRASVALGALGFALVILRSRLVLAEMLYLVLPIAACSGLVLAVRGRGIRVPLATALAAAALPLLCFIGPYVIDGQLGTLINGLLILPQKRLQFASLGMSYPLWILAGLPLAAVIVFPFRGSRASPYPVVRRLAVAALWVVVVTLPITALYNAWSYQLIWQSARGFTALLPVVSCWLLFSGRIQDAKHRWMLFGMVSMLAWASLVQFPFAGAIYFCYVTPLAVIAAAAAAGNAGIDRPGVRAAATLMLTFALLILNRGYIYNLGFEHDDSYALNVPLELDRASIQVSAADASAYGALVELIDGHLGDGSLIAGPDCPEVYFLTGQFSPTGAMFDFFVNDTAVEDGSSDMSLWTGARVVVLNHRRTFSPPPSSHLTARIRTLFPNVGVAGPFEVRWR